MIPAATSDPVEAGAHLVKYGVCRLEGALAPDELLALRAAVRQAAADDAASGKSYMYSGGANQRIWCLFNRDECFLRLAENAPALSVIRSVLGDDALLSNLSANIPGPAAGPWPRTGTRTGPHGRGRTPWSRT